MTRLIELEIQLRSFTKRQIVRFPESGMVMLTGKRNGEDTGSGTGKSSIPIAIAFALGFCDLPMSDLTNWYTDEKPFVRLRVQTVSGDIVDIIRDPKLSMIVNGVPHSGTSTAADELLKDIIKTATELTRILTYLPQRSSDRFITKTDSAQKEFLTTVLNLSKLENAEDAISERFKTAQSKHQTALGTIAQIDAIQSTVKIVTDEELQSAQSEMMRLDAARQVTDQAQAMSQHQEQIRLIDAEIIKINTIIQSAATATYQNNQIKNTVEQIKQQIETLKQNKCPTCKQEWLTTQSKIAELETQKQSLANSYKSNMAAIAAAQPYQNPEIITNLNAKKSQHQISIASFSAPIQQAEQNYQIASKNYSVLYNQVLQQKTLSERKQKAQEEANTYAIQEHILYHASQIGGRQGFLGDIFQKILQEIEEVANDYINEVSNVNTFTLQFGTESVTQKGKVNKKITSTLWKSGKQVKLKTLSGGQQSSIELAVELAVITVIKRRTGIDYGWLILDESMDGMDAPLKSEWISTIKTRIDSLLIVIDHSTEIKELFDSVIEVNFDGQSSEVVGG